MADSATIISESWIPAKHVPGLVSIVVPTYNRASLLPETLASVLAQTYRPIECIVVDDGSTDETAECMRSWCARSGPGLEFKYFRQNRSGGCTARNRGAWESAGEFLQFLDSDDLLLPKKLAIQVSVLRQENFHDMVYGLDEWFKHEPGDEGILWNAPDGSDPLDRFCWIDTVWNTGSPLWRRSSLERIEPWPETLGCWQDWAFHTLALSTGLRITHVPKVLQFVREHQGLRISNETQQTSHDLSRHRAASLVTSQLRRIGVLTGPRRDALATFCWDIGQSLTSKTAVSEGRRAVQTALLTASSLSLRACCLLTILGLTAAWLLRRNPASAFVVARRLVVRFHELPRHKSSLKMLKSPSKETPRALAESLLSARGA